MKNWSLNVRNNAEEIVNKLETTLGSAQGFVLELEEENNDSIRFKIHKRGLYAFYLMFVNKIIVNGKILKAGAKGESKLEISFNQYFLWKLIIITHLILGLGFIIAVFLGASSNPSLYIIGGLLLAIGIILSFAVRKKFEKDIQEYKTLISDILGA